MPSKSFLLFLSLLFPFITFLSLRQNTSNPMRAPSIFCSHGGPPTMFERTHPAYKEWQKMGKELKQAKGIVAVSAHWQSDLKEGVYVNNDETNPLVYDFYGFPPEYYKQTFKSNNPASFSSSISKQLGSHGIPTTFTKRGLDHGVWVPSLVAFDGELNSSIPLCQVSLPRSEDPVDSLKLGLALRSLRDQGIAIFSNGMAVHNLKDFMMSRRNGGLTKIPDYAESFSKALTEAMTQGTSQEEIKKESAGNFDVNRVEEPTKWKASKELFNRMDYLKAHPTPEHLLPALVALGASYDDEKGVETFELNEGPLCWNMYRWSKE